jgi:hypothetical protein
MKPSQSSHFQKVNQALNTRALKELSVLNHKNSRCSTNISSKLMKDIKTQQKHLNFSPDL